MQGTREGNYKLKALKISAIAIFSVVIVEVSVGLIVNSLAILSDGLHALLDAVSTIMLFFAVRASIKPPDEEHTYGHEKFETIGGLMGGIVLIAVAFLIFYEAAIRLIHTTQIAQGVEFAGFIAIALRSFYCFFKSYGFQENPACRKPLYEGWSLRCHFRFKLNFDSIAGVWLSYLRLFLWRCRSINLPWSYA